MQTTGEKGLWKSVFFFNYCKNETLNKRVGR